MSNKRQNEFSNIVKKTEVELRWNFHAIVYFLRIKMCVIDYGPGQRECARAVATNLFSVQNTNSIE